MAIETERRLELHCSLGPDILLIRHFSGHEQLGRCFEYALTLISEDHDIEMESLLGQHASVLVKLDAGERYFDGIVCQFSHAGRHGRYAMYRMLLRPWLWLLSQNQDCRVFQHESSVDIVKKVLHERGFSDIEESLLFAYAARDYCVQYRESELTFISRLLEQEGIYYYFRHERGKHTLVLADAASAHKTVPGFETIGYGKLADDKAKPGVFHAWSTTKRVRPGKVALVDYDFEKPRADMLAGSSDPKSHAHADAEFFDYPGHYKQLAIGQDRARVRIEEFAAAYEVANGSTNVPGLWCGALFKLVDHPRADQNREYLILGSSYEVDSGAFESGDSGGPLTFACQVKALDSQIPYRPQLVTHTPLVTGPQTATVVGPSGQEIWTDSYGRVKVQFHWDRDGKHDENSSCWVRVAHASAGSGWGAFSIPRIGHEVVVEFLEGDPDQPLITGSVYNNNNKPAYALTAHQTQSGIRTHSTKGGNASDYNELRFEDQKGSEELHLQAQRDLTTNVKHDSSTSIGHDHKHHVKNAMTVNVDEGSYKTTVARGAMSAEVPADTYRVKAKEIILESNGYQIHMDSMGIKLTVGGSQIQLMAGMVSVNGTLIKLNS